MTSGAATSAGLDRETLEMTVEALREFAAEKLPQERLLELDHNDEFPLETVRDMCGEGLGIQLLFIPEDCGGMGGGAFDVYRICEEMARIDLGVATGVLATFLGSDPIHFGGTEEQKQKWLSAIAEEGLLMAYCATEPQAGSDLGALTTIAKPVEKDGEVVGYHITGNKQWISNGGHADLYSVLAKAPGGPCWFVVESNLEGISTGKPEDKHGIRASNTSAVSFENVYVDADRLLGGVEGQGLLQAQAVFGYTRLMVAAFGLGAGWAAVDRAVPYSVDRIQAGGPLSEKQGYTHKLIVPHAVKLEASRFYIEETANRLDAGEGNLNTEGAIAKYMASEAGLHAADASIQALGGYGYTREYMVEKIKRDVRITTIYEGTSEIMEMTIGRDRWQEHLKTRGRYYHDHAAALDDVHRAHPEVGADVAALGFRALAEVMERARTARLTRNQHLLMRMGEWIALAECAGCFSRRAAAAQAGTAPTKTYSRFDAAALAVFARVFARDAASRTANEGLQLLIGAGGVDAAEVTAMATALCIEPIQRAQLGMLADMDRAADILYGRAST